MSSPSEQENQAPTQLPRTLGIWGLWLLVVNGLVGAGIFGLPAGVAKLSGNDSLWLYPICALLILPVLLCFAELASYFKESGGPVRYVGEAFGPVAGFQAGWLYYLARLVSFAANSALLVASFSYFWPAAAEGGSRALLLLLICGGLTLLNVKGSVQSIQTLGWLSLFKFGVLLTVVILAFAATPTTMTTPKPVLVTDYSAAIVLLIYAFVGFESAVVPAGEARQPQRDLPRALLLGLGTVTLLYVLIQWQSQRIHPDLAQSSTPLLDVAAMLAGPVGATFLMLGVFTSVGANLLGAIFSTPRISYALAQEKHLPAWFCQIHPRYRTPANAIWFFGILAFALALFGSFIYLATATVLIRALLYGSCCAAIPKLRPRFASPTTFILPLGMTIPALGFAACGWLLMQVKADAFGLTFALLALGALLYGLARYQTRV